MFVILVSSVAVGYILLVLSYMIPADALTMGLANSVFVLQNDTEDEVIRGYHGSRLDVYTDGALMNAVLNNVDESPLKRAVACYQYYSVDKSPGGTFVGYFSGEEPIGSTPYPRYWFGILAILRPLFVYANYSDIRVINHIAQTMLVCLVVYAFARRKKYMYIPAVFMTYLFLMPYTLPLAIQYSPVFYIGFGSLACLMLNYDKLAKKDGLFLLFLLTGILTSYFDLLTYPVFTLGIPLTGLLIAGEKKDESIKEDERSTKMSKYIRFAACGISWFVGYAGMWAGKMLISIMVYGSAAVHEITENVSKRSSFGAAEEGISYFDAIRSNFDMYDNHIYRDGLIVYTLFSLVYVLFMMIKKRGRFSLFAIPMFLCIMAVPFVWYFVTTEHADVHAFMTYKDLTVAVFGYCVMLISLVRVSKVEDEALIKDTNKI